MSDPREPMHPQVQILFQAMRAMRPVPIPLTAEAQRAALDMLSEAINADPPHVASDEVAHFDSVRVRIVRPIASPERPPPVLVYFHGGGWVIGTPEGYVRLTHQLALGTGAVVVNVDYRRAPEHRFPAALDDCEKVVRHLAEHGASLGIDPTRIAVAGDSAGGNLSAACALRLGDRASSILRGALLYYPSLEAYDNLESIHTFGPGDPILPIELKEFFRDSYVPDREVRKNPFVSPLRGDLASFPETCMIVGTIDPLYSEDMAFVRKLEASKRKVELHVHQGMPHGFVQLLGFDDAERALETSVSFLRRVLA